MKLYTHPVAPNPWRVRIFCFEKDIKLDLVNMKLEEGEARTPDFLRKNSLGEVPVLELDDGRVLAESVAICRYLEALHPEPRLMGKDAFEQAQIEMWNRRMELHIVGAVGSIGLHTIPFFAGRIEQMPDYADTQRRVLAKKWAWLDGELSDGRPFVAGERFTIADITGMMALKVADFVEEAVPTDLAHVRRWEKEVRARPSWNA